MKCGVWSVRSAVRSVGREEYSLKSEVWSVDCEVWSVKCQACSLKSAGWSEVWSAKSAVWSVKCGVWRVQWVVRSAKWICKCDLRWSQKIQLSSSLLESSTSMGAAVDIPSVSRCGSIPATLGKRNNTTWNNKTSLSEITGRWCLKRRL